MAAHFVAGWATFTLGRIDASDTHLRAFEELLTLDPPVRLGGAISTVEVSAAGYADGPARIDAAYAAYLESGIRLFVPLYLLLRAEVHGSADLVDQARAASAELDDVCLSPRLLALSTTLQRTRKP